MWYLIGIYLISIVLANLSVAYFGASVVLINAFTLIALDLTVGDRLHELWQHKNLLRNSAILIICGSLLSAILDYNALPVAIASCLAFAISQTSDRLAYQYWHKATWYRKVTYSNIISAGFDSAIFLTLLTLLTHQPFTWFLALLILAQWCCKITGGLLWGYVLKPRTPKLILDN